MIPHQSIHAELTNLAASQAAFSVSGTLPKLTPAQMAALASGLGRKNGVKVIFDNSATACTDGKTIILPLTSKENSWIVRGFIDHELSHIRFSDLDLAPRKPPFERSLWNIIEDVRIEKALGDAYPGAATNLSTLVSELLRTKAGVFEVPPGSPPEAVICGYVGLTLRTLYLRQHMLADLALNTRDQFLNTFGPELERDLFGIITQIGSVADTAGVVDMVKQIVALLEKYRDAPDNSESDSKSGSEEEQPVTDNQDSPDNLSQSQQIPDNQDQPDNPNNSGQSQTDPADPDNPDNSEKNPDTSDDSDKQDSPDKSGTSPDNPDQHETSSDQLDNPNNQDNSGKSPDTSEQPDNSEQAQGDQDQLDDPDQYEQDLKDQESSATGPSGKDPSTQPNHPLDQQGAQNDPSIPVPDNFDQTDLDNTATVTEESLSENQVQEDQVSDAASLGVGTGGNHSQSDPTPEQEAITQALESQEEVSDFGSQLRELARDNEHLLGNDPQSFQVAVPALKHLLPKYAYSEQPIMASSAIVSKLSAELKALLQAQGLARNTPSSAGNRIARSRLHRIRTGESKLFLRNNTTRQINTVIHLLVDISGSMAGTRLLTTKDVVFALIKTLAHQRGINLALTLFPGFYPYNTSPSGDPVYPVAALLSHGQKPASKLLWPLTARGCTPLAESLRYVLSSMVHLSETRKLVILLTDGNPNDDRTARLALDEAQSLGIEVAALGIEGLSNTALFPVCEIVDRVEHLPQKAFKLLESLLTQNKE